MPITRRLQLVVEALEERTLLAGNLLDPSFGIGGKLTSAIALPASSRVLDSAPTADGKWLVVALIDGGNDPLLTEFAAPVLTRLNSDGTLDTSFGTGGQAALDARFYVNRDFSGDFKVAVGSDGRIFVAGVGPANEFADNFSVLVSRFQANGSVDSGFGSNGIVAVSQSEIEGVIQIAVQNDGKLVVLTKQGNELTENEAIVRRILASGAIDAGFGFAGKVTLDLGSLTGRFGTEDIPKVLVVTPDNKILIGGDVGPFQDDPGFCVVRLTGDGSIDPTFGSATNPGHSFFPAPGPSTAYYLTAATSVADGCLLAGAVFDTTTGRSDQWVRKVDSLGFADFGFGNAGMAFADIGFWDTVERLVPLPGNKFLMIGQSAVGDPAIATHLVTTAVRFHANGQLDPSFSFDGKVTIGDGSRDFLVNHARVGSDGKFTLLGYTADSSAPQGILAEIATYRLLADGSLDSTYDGDGIQTQYLRTTLDTSPQLSTVQADGKILVAGILQGAIGQWYLARYLPTGALDETFGQRGVVKFSAVSFDTVENYEGIVVRPNGRIVVGGWARFDASFAESDLVVMQFLPNGQPDPGFGFEGNGRCVFNFVAADFGGKLALQGDGKLLVISEESDEMRLRISRINANGELDVTFGENGAQFLANHQARAWPLPYDLTIDTNGRANLVSAYRGMVRLTVHGQYDATFGNDGIATFPTTMGYFNQIAVLPSGQLIVAGHWNPDNETSDVRLTRLNPNGTRDTGFGTDGTTTINVAARDEVTSLLPMANGQVMVVGRASPNNESPAGDLFLARVSTNGSIDSSFGTSGTAIFNFGASTALGDHLTGHMVNASTLLVTSAVGDPSPEGIIHQRMGVMRFQLDAMPPTLTRLELVGDFANKNVAAIDLYFSELLATSAISTAGFQLRLAGKDKKLGTADDVLSGFTTRYDAARRSITLTPNQLIPFGQFTELRIRGNLLRDAAGNLLDGDGDGAAGGDWLGSVGRGATLSYADGNGDNVSLTTNRGTLHVIRDADGEARELRLIDAILGKTTLTGSVTKPAGVLGDGWTTIRQRPDFTGVTNKLSNRVLLANLPGSVVTWAASGLSTKLPAKVVFRHADGSTIRVPGTVISSTRVSAAVPPFMNRQTGELTSGVFDVVIVQNVNGREVTRATTRTYTAAPPVLEGIAAGDVTLRILEALASTYAQTRTAYAALGPASQGTIYMQRFLDALTQQEAAMNRLLAEVRKVQSGARSHLDLGRVGTTNLRVSRNELAMVDRLLAAALVANADLPLPTEGMTASLASVPLASGASWLDRVSQTVTRPFFSAFRQAQPFIDRFREVMLVVVPVASFATGIILRSPGIAASAAALASMQVFMSTTLVPQVADAAVASVRRSLQPVRLDYDEFATHNSYIGTRLIPGTIGGVLESPSNLGITAVGADYGLVEDVVQSSDQTLTQLADPAPSPPSLLKQIGDGYEPIVIRLDGGTPGQGPQINATPEVIEIAYQPGVKVPGPRTITIRNVGTGSERMRFSVESLTPWISIKSGRTGTLAAGKSATTQFTVDPRGMSPGVYEGTINIISPNAMNSPKKVKVLLTVGTASGLAGSYATTSFQAQGFENGQFHTYTVTAALTIDRLDAVGDQQHVAGRLRITLTGHGRTTTIENDLVPGPGTAIYNPTTREIYLKVQNNNSDSEAGVAVFSGRLDGVDLLGTFFGGHGQLGINVYPAGGCGCAAVNG